MIGFWDLLTHGADELGLSPAAATALRRRITGHSRPLSVRWASTIGCWGRVRDFDYIAGLVGRPRRAVKGYASASGLYAATSKRRRTPAQLAVGLYADRGRDAAAGRRRWACSPPNACCISARSRKCSTTTP